MQEDSKVSSFDLKDFLRHSGKYIFTNFASKAVGLLSLPFLTRYLSPSEYGVISVYNVLLQLLLVLGTFNFQTAIIRYYYEEKDDFKSFFSTIFTLIVGLLFLVSVCLYFFKEEIAFFFNIPSVVIPLLIPTFIGVFCFKFLNELFISKGESTKVMYWNLIYEYSKLFMLVIVILFFVDGFLGKIIGELVVIVVYFFVSLFFLKGYIEKVFKLKYIKYAVLYSFPLVLYSLSTIMLGHCDKIIINSLEGNVSVGLYGYAYELGLLLAIFNQALHNAARPTFYQLMDQRAFLGLNKQANFIIRAILLGTLGLIYGIRHLGELIANDSFYSSLDIVIVIILGYTFMGFFQLFGKILFYFKKTFALSLIMIVSGGVNLILNFIFIPDFGYKIAAFTTLFSFIIMLVLGITYCYKSFDMNWFPFKEMLKYSFIFGIFALIGFWCETLLNNFLIEIILKIFLILFFIFTLFYEEGRKILYKLL